MSSKVRLGLGPLLAALLCASDCDPDVNDRDVVIAVTSRVSVDSSGREANRDSKEPSVTPDGRYVAFASQATNLVPGIGNGRFQVFVKDLVTGAVVVASVNASGAPGDGNSFAPSISASGRRIAFQSEASNLAATDPDSALDVFVRDLDTGTTFHVSQAFGGGPSDAVDGSGQPSLSADGTFVAFDSDANNLVDPPLIFGVSQIYRTEIDAGTTVLVSVNDSGDEPNGSSHAPWISADGNVIAFHSGANDLSPLDPDNDADVYVRDIQAGTTELISVEAAGNPDGISDGVQANGVSAKPWLSADGQVVVFESEAPDLVAGDINGNTDVFVRRRGGATTLVSRHSSGAQGGAGSFLSVGSAEGRYVAFFSDANNLVDGDSNFGPDHFWHDTVTGRTVRVSVRTGGGQVVSGIAAARPSMTADGRKVFFISDSGQLVDSDTNGAQDIFAYGPLY